MTADLLLIERAFRMAMRNFRRVGNENDTIIYTGYCLMCSKYNNNKFTTPTTTIITI